MKKRLTSNGLIGVLRDKPQVFLIRTHTRRKGTTYCLSDTLQIVDQPVADRLVEKGVLVDRGDALPATGVPGQSYALADEWRAK